MYPYERNYHVLGKRPRLLFHLHKPNTQNSTSKTTFLIPIHLSIDPSLQKQTSSTSNINRPTPISRTHHVTTTTSNHAHRRPGSKPPQNKLIIVEVTKHATKRGAVVSAALSYSHLLTGGPRLSLVVVCSDGGCAVNVARAGRRCRQVGYLRSVGMCGCVGGEGEGAVEGDTV